MCSIPFWDRFPLLKSINFLYHLDLDLFGFGLTCFEELNSSYYVINVEHLNTVTCQMNHLSLVRTFAEAFSENFIKINKYTPRSRYLYVQILSDIDSYIVMCKVDQAKKYI